jgi:hypothetical protein
LKNEAAYKAKKSEQLGMPIDKARDMIKKRFMLHLAEQLGVNFCYQCGEPVTTDDMSIEHKISFVGAEDPLTTFFDMDNIALSHKKCNTAARRTDKPTVHPSMHSYNKGCRCDECKEVKRLWMQDYRANK